MKRKTFPGNDGIYKALGGIADHHYLNEEDAQRYRYLRPAYPKDPHNKIVVSDCWIVDKDGNTNPGTDASPVPFYLEALGKRVA